MVRRFLTAACAAIVAFPCVSLAAADLAAVVVTATRFSEADPGVAANISVITRQDIDREPGGDSEARQDSTVWARSEIDKTDERQGERQTIQDVHPENGAKIRPVRGEVHGEPEGERDGEQKSRPPETPSHKSAGRHSQGAGLVIA